jgi:hypothetical protein
MRSISTCLNSKNRAGWTTAALGDAVAAMFPPTGILSLTEKRFLGCWALVAAVVSGGVGAALAQTYTTDFDSAENPIDEDGVWNNTGDHWTHVHTYGGAAFGTQSGDGGYDDSYAYLSGFPPDQSASGVIKRLPGSNGSHEVEILLRWSDSAESAQGYEILVHYNGGWAEIVRWNGPYGDFTYLDSSSNPPDPETGDVLSASITGNLIIAYFNGEEFMRATDNTYTPGNPGIGFFKRYSDGDYIGFSRYTATGQVVGVEDELQQPVWLGPNRPNPFNGGTTIHYRLEASGHVSLKVYDVLGREVATLVEGSVEAGDHTAWFGGNYLASGVYLARLMSGDIVETQRMTLVK